MNKIKELGLEDTNDVLLDKIKELCEKDNIDFKQVIEECNIVENNEEWQNKYIKNKDFQTIMRDFANVDEIDIHCDYIKLDGYEHLESIDQVDIDSVYDYYVQVLEESKEKEYER